MNINKSYIFTVFLGCIFATQAYAANKLKSDSSNASDGCEFLYVHISNKILDDYTLAIERLIIIHGGNQDCKTELFGGKVCRFFQSTFYGPDATLSFKNKKNVGDIGIIRVQQNLCVTEAGSITVQPLRGEWKYRTREGSWGGNLPGEVWLSQVSLNN